MMFSHIGDTDNEPMTPKSPPKSKMKPARKSIRTVYVQKNNLQKENSALNGSILSSAVRSSSHASRNNRSAHFKNQLTETYSDEVTIDEY